MRAFCSFFVFFSAVCSSAVCLCAILHEWSDLIIKCLYYLYIYRKIELGNFDFYMNVFCSQQEKMLKEENQLLEKQVKSV